MITTSRIFSIMCPDHQRVVSSLFNHASSLLDHTPRFKYFTLHGSQHIINIFSIADLLIAGGLTLTKDEAYILASAMCLHDVGMVIPLKNMNPEDILGGVAQLPEPNDIEKCIRDLHHEFIGQYIQNHFDFATSLGISLADLGLIQQVARAHRRVNINNLPDGYAKNLGALLRVIDELDITPTRAPLQVLLDQCDEMDSTSCWHWVKHNLCKNWRAHDNVKYEVGGTPRITFTLSVHPPMDSAIPYWLNQIKRPLHRVIFSEGCANIITDRWGIKFFLQDSPQFSAVAVGNEKWAKIAEKAISSGRKTILFVDDEVRKLRDLLLPLSQQYQILYSPNARDAISKLETGIVDLALLDLQVGSCGMWSEEETADFKMTGFVLARHIAQNFPKVKVAILTGSRHDISEWLKKATNIAFLCRKPISMDDLEKEVNHVLR
jgi:hypothetical protein